MAPSCKLVTGIDDHSRYCVVAHLVIQATGRAVCQALVAALGGLGAARAEVLTDNGVQFTGRFAKPRRVEVLFERILRRQRDHPPPDQGPLADHHREGGAVPPDAAAGAARATERPFASLEQAQKAVDAWVEDYNHQRPHQALAMAVPASRFRSRQGGPGEPGAGGGRRCRTHRRPRAILGPVELEVLVPASGNLQLVGRQLWVGRSLAGQPVRIWADLRSIHLSATSDGRLLKTVASRYTPDELALLHGHPTARPAGPAPAAAAALQGAAVVEVDRVVNGCRAAGHRGPPARGRAAVGRPQVTVRVAPTLLQVVCDGRVVKTLPSPVPAELPAPAAGRPGRQSAA